MKKFYVDATFDKHTHISFVGFCDLSMSGSVQKLKFKDNNLAEIYAVSLCLKSIPKDLSCVILTDSQKAVDHYKNNQLLPEGVQIEHIPRALNIADGFIRAYKEEHNVNKRHYAETKEAKKQKAASQSS